MKKIIPGILVLIVTVFLISGCEGIFTKSVFEDFAKDPSDMSPEQLEEYARDVLGSGDKEDMADALDALADDLPDDPADDPELYLLAAELALGASGLTDAINDALSDILDGNIDEDFDYTELLDSLDSDLIADSVEYFEALAALDDAEEVISDGQYANAAIAQAFIIIDEADGDLDSIDEDDPRLDQVEEWADLGGVDISDYLSLPEDTEI